MSRPPYFEDFTGAEDPIAVRRDDLLLDALGRGEQPDDPDPAIALLYGWRAELSQGADQSSVGETTTRTIPRRSDNPRPHHSPVTLRPGRPAPDRPRRNTRPRRRRSHRALSTVVAALFTVAGLGAATIAAAADAKPGDALWPVTRAVYNERAMSRQAALEAARAIERAREAAKKGHTAEARRHLAEAEREAERVRQPDEAERLRHEADEIRKKLPPTEAPSVVSPSPGSTAPSETPSAPSPSESSEPASPSQTPTESKERGRDGEAESPGHGGGRGRPNRVDLLPPRTPLVGH